MDDKVVPAPGTPTNMQRFVGGFKQAWGESLAPTVGRVALAGIGAMLLVVAVIGLLAALMV